jgi:hypothetical protein
VVNSWFWKADNAYDAISEDNMDVKDFLEKHDIKDKDFATELGDLIGQNSDERADFDYDHSEF